MKAQAEHVWKDRCVDCGRTVPIEKLCKASYDSDDDRFPVVGYYCVGCIGHLPSEANFGGVRAALILRAY